jgi:hypothetical protein
VFCHVWPHLQTSEVEFRTHCVTYVRLKLCSSLGSSGKRWTPYLLSSNRTPSLKIQRPPFTYPAVPPGTCSSSTRVAKRPRMSTSTWRYTGPSTGNYQTSKYGISAGTVRVGAEQATRKETIATRRMNFVVGVLRCTMKKNASGRM